MSAISATGFLRRDSVVAVKRQGPDVWSVMFDNGRDVVVHASDSVVVRFFGDDPGLVEWREPRPTRLEAVFDDGSLD